MDMMNLIQLMHPNFASSFVDNSHLAGENKTYATNL